MSSSVSIINASKDKKKPGKVSGGKIIYLILMIAFGFFISQYLTEIEDVIVALSQGKLIFIILAFLFEALYYIFTTQFSIQLLEHVSIKLGFKRMFSLFVSSVFLNVTAPGGSVGGMLYQVKKVAEETKSDTGKVFMALIMVILNMYWAFLILAFISLWFVFTNGMEYAAMFTAIILFALISGFAIAVYNLILHYPSKLLEFALKAKWITAIIKKFGGTGGEEWIEKNIGQMHDAARLFSEGDKLFVSLVSSGMMLHIIQITILLYVMLAFNIAFSPSLLIVGYTTMYLFTVISPTPQGLGVAEGVAQLVFVAFGVEPEKALLAVLAYRAITVWIPVFLGFIAFRLRSKIVKKS
jgi:uncharacterized protein (TIRG00374 family)